MPEAKSKRHPLPKRREIDLRSHDYQPRKAELEEEIDMPNAKLETVRSAFFRRVKVRESGKTD